MGDPSFEWIIQPQIKLPILSVARSFPVSTSITPGIFLASETSTLLMLAWACGERTNTARVAPGLITSSVYRPLPVIKRRSSFRRTAAPIPVALMAVSPTVLVLFSGLSCATLCHCFGSRCDGFDDVVVARTPTNISVELLADRVLIEIVAAPPYDIEGCHDHPGSTESTLKRVMFAERFLHRMQRAVRLCETFDCGDLGAFALQSEGGARLGRNPINVNDASTALRRVTADMCTGQPQILAQKLHQ